MHRIILLLSTAAVAFAEVEAGGPAPATPSGATGGGTAAPASGFSPQLIILPLILALVYFMMIRPQRREEARRKAMTGGLKRGDRVITIGGLHGEVVAIGEKTVDLKVGQDGREMVLTFNKGAVSSTAAEPELANRPGVRD